MNGTELIQTWRAALTAAATLVSRSSPFLNAAATAERGRSRTGQRMTLAAWVPGWYELDPPLQVGMADEFAFWRVVPEHLVGSERLVLYNTLWHPEDAVVAQGTVATIRHPDLGEIRKVDTRGLDYTLTLADGTELLVNAEEEPGKLFERVGEQWAESARVVRGWRFVVEFAALTEPQPADQGAS